MHLLSLPRLIECWRISCGALLLDLRLLNGSHFNYVMLGSPNDPRMVQRIILTSKSGGTPETAPSNPSEAANQQQIYPQQPIQLPEAEEMPVEEVQDESNPEVDQAEQKSSKRPMASSRSRLRSSYCRNLQRQQQQQQQQPGAPQGFPQIQPQPQPHNHNRTRRSSCRICNGTRENETSLATESNN
jgi:hypothetical protein